MTVSRSIHVSTMTQFLSFFWLSNIPSLYMYHIFFIHSSVSGHLGCFRVQAIVNSAAMNIGVHVSFLIHVFVFFGEIPRSGIAGSYSSYIFNYLSDLHTVFLSGCANLISTNSARCFLFLYILANICYLRFFDDSHSDRCTVIFHCGFDLHLQGHSCVVTQKQKIYKQINNSNRISQLEKK